jgi:transcriptional regulator with XRE-family HTH domain
VTVEAGLRAIGPRVVQLRRERRISQDMLVALSGLSSGVVSRLERGESNPSLSTILRLAVALDLGSIEQLLGELPSRRPTAAAASDRREAS